MRICVLTSSYPRFKGDGHAQFVEQLNKGFAGKGNSVTVVCPRNNRTGTRSKDIRNNVRIVRFPYFFPSKLERLNYEGGIPASLRYCKWAFIQLPFFYFMFLVKAWKYSKKADIIHAHWIPSGAIAYLVSKIRKIPYVVTIRGSDKELMRIGATKPIAKFILKNAAHVSTVNQILKDNVEKLGLQHRQVTAIYNGIEIERFKPADKLHARSDLGIGSNQRVILYVGNMIKQKGLLDLAKAIRKIAPNHKQLSIILVGKGAAKAELEHLLWKYGLTHIFHFTGAIQHGRLHKYFQAADIFVLPSHSEGRPNVVLEAMSTGTCTVATKVGGIPEIIVDKENGRLVRSKNPDELAKVFEELLSNPVEMRRLGENGRKWSLQNSLSWEQSATLFLELFENLIKQYRNRKQKK